jgi:prophage regulatory protein
MEYIVSQFTQERLLRKSEVLKLTGLSKSTLHNYIQLGRIKRPVPIGPRMVGFPASEIGEFISACIAARGEK